MDFRRVRFPWCSGYHICLTRRRSPVRSRTETFWANWRSLPSTIWFNLTVFARVAKNFLFLNYRDEILKIVSQTAGFEPALPKGIWFRVRRLNHSATSAMTFCEVFFNIHWQLRIFWQSKKGKVEGVTFLPFWNYYGLTDRRKSNLIKPCIILHWNIFPDDMQRDYHLKKSKNKIDYTWLSLKKKSFKYYYFSNKAFF